MNAYRITRLDGVQAWLVTGDPLPPPERGTWWAHLEGVTPKRFASWDRENPVACSRWSRGVD